MLGYATMGLVVFVGLLLLAILRRREPEPELAEAPPAPPGPTLEQLSAAVEQSPSYDNRVRMGWALLHAQQPERAQGYFEQALATHRKDKQALYGLGISQLECGAATTAIETLSRLIERGFAYEDYEAALALAEAHARAGDNDQAAELLSQVADESGRFEHRSAGRPAQRAAPVRHAAGGRSPAQRRGSDRSASPAAHARVVSRARSAAQPKRPRSGTRRERGSEASRA